MEKISKAKTADRPGKKLRKLAEHDNSAIDSGMGMVVFMSPSGWYLFDVFGYEVLAPGRDGIHSVT